MGVLLQIQNKPVYNFIQIQNKPVYNCIQIQNKPFYSPTLSVQRSLFPVYPFCAIKLAKVYFDWNVTGEIIVENDNQKTKE